MVSNTRVAVRVRPMTNIERDLGAGRCLNISGGNRVACSDARTWNSEDFTFDHAWELDETQEEVYAAIGEPALRAAWDGYDVGVMAYGQTGTGKTYTLWGDDRGRDDRGRVDDIAFDHDAGLIPRIGADLFARVERERAGAVVGGSGTGAEVRVEMSAFEIHCELARDLLAPVSSERDKDDRGDHDLEVAKDGSVHGLTARPVASRKQFEGFLAEATRRRAGSAWRRSHVVVRLVLTRFPRGGSGGAPVSSSSAPVSSSGVATAALRDAPPAVSRLTLVDASGSERSAAGADSPVNRSTSALRRCVDALAARARSGEAVASIRAITAEDDDDDDDGGAPDDAGRDEAALTRVFRESLGGNARSFLVATVSPSDDDHAETLDTLRFAASMRLIRCRTIVNVDPDARRVTALKREVAESARVLEALKKDLSLARVRQTGGAGSRPGSAAGQRQGAGAFGTTRPKSALTKPARDEPAGRDPLDIRKEMRNARTNLELSEKRLKAAEGRWNTKVRGYDKQRAIHKADVSTMRPIVDVSQNDDETRWMPRLVRLHEDPSLTGSIWHVLRTGTTRIGAGNECELRVWGLGVKASHCTVNVRVAPLDRSLDGAAVRNSARVVVPNLGEAAVFVNGEKVDQPNGVELSHGDRICVGLNSGVIFRYDDPASVSGGEGREMRGADWVSAQAELRREGALTLMSEAPSPPTAREGEAEGGGGARGERRRRWRAALQRRVVYLLALVDEANERCVEMRLDVNFRARFGGGTMGAPPSVASNNPAAPLLEVTMTRGEDDPWGERARGARQILPLHEGDFADRALLIRHLHSKWRRSGRALGPLAAVVTAMKKGDIGADPLYVLDEIGMRMFCLADACPAAAKHAAEAENRPRVRKAPETKEAATPAAAKHGPGKAWGTPGTITRSPDDGGVAARAIANPSTPSVPGISGDEEIDPMTPAAVRRERSLRLAAEQKLRELMSAAEEAAVALVSEKKLVLAAEKRAKAAEAKLEKALDLGGELQHTAQRLATEKKTLENAPKPVDTSHLAGKALAVAEQLKEQLKAAEERAAEAEEAIKTQAKEIKAKYKAKAEKAAEECREAVAEAEAKVKRAEATIREVEAKCREEVEAAEERARTCSLPLPPNTGPLGEPLQVIPQGGNENQDTYTRASNYAAQADEVAARITGITPYYPPRPPTPPEEKNLPGETDFECARRLKAAMQELRVKLWTVGDRNLFLEKCMPLCNQEMMLWKAQCLEKHADVVACETAIQEMEQAIAEKDGLIKQMRKQLKAWERAERGEFGGDGSSNDDDDEDGEGKPPKKMTEEEMLKELEQFDEAFKGITFADIRKQANLFGEELGLAPIPDPTPPAEEMEELRPTPEKFDKKATPMVPRMRLPGDAKPPSPVPRPVKKSSAADPFAPVPVSHKKTAPPRTPELQDEEDLDDKMYGDELEPTRKDESYPGEDKDGKMLPDFLFAESGKENAAPGSNSRTPKRWDNLRRNFEESEHRKEDRWDRLRRNLEEAEVDPSLLEGGGESDDGEFDFDNRRGSAVGGVFSPQEPARPTSNKYNVGSSRKKGKKRGKKTCTIS